MCLEVCQPSDCGEFPLFILSERRGSAALIGVVGCLRQCLRR